MIRPDQIPDEVVEAMSEADHGTTTYAELLAAALNVWPGFEYRVDAAFPAFGYGPAAVVLPLPQEP